MPKEESVPVEEKDIKTYRCSVSFVFFADVDTDDLEELKKWFSKKLKDLAEGVTYTTPFTMKQLGDAKIHVKLNSEKEGESKEEKEIG